MKHLILENKLKGLSISKLVSVATVCASGFLLGACSSQSILPKSEEVKLSREIPTGCVDLGKVTGLSLSVKASNEVVLEDLKKAAANKGANHVVVQQWSAQGTSVTGQAYQCK